jgi:tetratricopeptide (TPR) repeat protein
MDSDQLVLDQVNNISELNYLTTKGYKENLSIGVARSEKQLAAFKLLLEHPFFIKADKGMNQRRRLYQLSLPMTYSMVSGETDKVVSGCVKMIKHYEKHNFLIEYTPIGYVSANFILGAAYRERKNYKKSFAQVEKLTGIIDLKYVKRSQKATASALIYRYILHFQLLLLENRYDEALILYPKSISELKDYHVFIGKPQLYDLYFQYSKMFFIVGDLDKTLYYTNEILNDLKFKDRDDFAITLRLFNLIVHFELENDLTLEYLSRSTYQYFRRKNKLYKAEKYIIRFLKNFSNYKHKGITHEKLVNLKEMLEDLYHDKFEKGTFRLFDFRLWVEHLLNEVSIKDIIRK